MTTAILKIIHNETVCKVCDFIEMVFIMSVPFAIPLFIMYASSYGY